MGHAHNSPVFFQPIDCCLKLGFGPGVERSRSFIQDDNGRVAHESSSNGNPLPLVP